MQVPLEISFRNFEPSEFLERRVRERVDKLHQFFNRIISCRVSIEVPHRSQVHALAYHARIEVRVPEKVLVVNRDPGDQVTHFDAYVTIRDAFDAMERQLDDYAHQMRDDVKVHDGPLQGEVRRLFADHGFIATTDGQEIYFHRNSLTEGEFDRLEPGTAVELVLIHGESPAGPQATTVRPIRPTQLREQPQG